MEHHSNVHQRWNLEKWKCMEEPPDADDNQELGVELETVESNTIIRIITYLTNLFWKLLTNLGQFLPFSIFW